MLAELTADFSPKPAYDLCVIGAGAAGITLAQKARALGLSVFLAEAGGLEFSSESQDCYRGKIEGDDYFSLDEARLRYFGGTTNHWGGMSRPLEAIDFAPKAASPLGGWPIGREALAGFEAEARSILEIPDQPPDTPFAPELGLRRVHFVFSPPVRFGEKFGPAMARDPEIDVCLNCNAVGVDFEGQTLRAIRFQNYDDDEIKVVARAYVLACGGIENSRLLLHWNAAYNNALGNSTDLVGRYWMEHPTQTVGWFLLCGEMRLADDAANLPISAERLYLAPTAELMETERILTGEVRLDRIPNPEVTDELELLCERGWLGELLLGAASLSLKMGWVRTSTEQAAVRDNCITLGVAKDRFAIPAPVLHWRRSLEDKRTMQVLAWRTAAYFAQGKIGRVRLDPWLLADDNSYSCAGGGHCPGGFHHMGGTRMADAPSAGVVDGNCRVYGTENLFVAGSSVFPSAGYCNPTMSIVQLSLRLATHLKGLLA